MAIADASEDSTMVLQLKRDKDGKLASLARVND